MAAHLWTKKPPPWEYIELYLCRDVYHCTPSQLREESAKDIYAHLAILGIEADIANKRSKKHGR